MTNRNDLPVSWRARRSTRTAAIAGGLALLAAACSSGHKAALPTTLPPTTAATTTTEPPTTTTTRPPVKAVQPLTGLPATSSRTTDPAVVVKIDNVDQARPQTGLQYADIVYEAEVEGGLSRLAAVFQSTYPTDVGPVRSGRLTDEGVADDLNHPVLTFSGTNGIFLPLLRAQPLTEVDASNHPEQFRRVGYNAPHNYYVSVASLATLSTTHQAPRPLFTYLPASHAFGGAGVAAASGISMSFPAASVSWSDQPRTGLWSRMQNGTADTLIDGSQISAVNVVVYFCNYIVSGVASGEGVADATIPEGILTGTGPVWVLSRGRIVKGTWHRADLTHPATYTDSANKPIALTPGNTWVELLPSGSAPTVTP